MSIEYRKKIISDYVASVNFKKDWSISKITEDLASLLKEKPAIVVDWKNETGVNETGVNNTVISKPEKITIYFTDGELKPSFVTFII